MEGEGGSEGDLCVGSETVLLFESWRGEGEGEVEGEGGLEGEKGEGKEEGDGEREEAAGRRGDAMDRTAAAVADRFSFHLMVRREGKGRKVKRAGGVWR